MLSDQPIYQVKVDQLLVDRNNLSWVERLAAILNGKYPKVLLHKIECPCCGKVSFHRALQNHISEEVIRSGNQRSRDRQSGVTEANARATK